MLAGEALHWSKRQKFLLKKHTVYGSHPLSPVNTYVLYRCFSNVTQRASVQAGQILRLHPQNDALVGLVKRRNLYIF